MLSLPASIKRIGSKTTKKKWRHHFPHYKSIGVFFRCSRADNSVVGGPIWPKFELVQDNMHVLVTYKFKMDRINSNREPEDYWSCIAHLIAKDMLKSAVIEEKTFKHSPWAGADNPLGPKFWCQQVGLITMVICCKFTKNPFNLWLYTHLFMI